jgi:hypothetical protein
MFFHDLFEAEQRLAPALLHDGDAFFVFFDLRELIEE